MGSESGPVSLCIEGHSGVACAECKPGFAIADTKCESCGNEKIGEKIGAIVFGVCCAAAAGYASLKWLTPEIAVKLKILIAMGQVLGGFKETYEIKWPKIFRVVLEQMKIFNLDLFAFGNIGCQIPAINSFYYKFLVTVCTPAAGLGVVRFCLARHSAIL